MPTGATGQLGLALPVQGELSGTWGNTVNNGITEYTNIAIAGTLSFAGDGAITLANTTGDASATNIGATTAQYMVIRITGTQSVTKVITGPSYSKLYMVDHAGATSAVTFKASGQAGVTVAVGEKCFVYYNGTDYVKVSSSVADGVTSVGGTGTVNGITLTGTVTSTGNLTLGGTLSGVNLTSQVTGTLPIANGGTGSTSTTFVNLASNVTGTLPIANGGTGSASTTFVNLASNVTGTLPIANGGTGSTSTAFVNLASNVTGTLPVANGGTGLTSGTSGGVLYYSATGTLASSGALTANKVLLGGGAGAAPTATSLLGTAAAVTTGTYIQAVGYADTLTALGNTGTAINIDVTSANVFTATLTGNCTFTLRYPVATGSSSFTLILTNDGTAGRTVAWAGGTFRFPGGSVTRTTTANAVDVWFFFTPNGGTTWYGSIPMANLS
jgi:hypothetical protein